MARQRKAAKTHKDGTQTTAQDKRLYTLDVFLVGGPLADEFVAQNPVVSRTIDIRADQTLAELHGAIFQAFDRDEQHLVWLKISAVSTPLKLLRLGVYWTARSRYGLYPEEGL